jgi:AcrR family transcriptional regulator
MIICVISTHAEPLTEAPGRRERKKQATRQALHEAAWTLVEERGLANVTIEAITDRVDVAARTFFNYYSSKEEAVLGRDTERVERVCQMLAERLAAGDAPLDALHRTMRDESGWWDQTSDHLRRRMQLMRDEPLLFSCGASQWEEMSRRMAELIAGTTGADPEVDVFPLLLVNVTVVATRTAMMHWAEHPEQDLAALIDTAIDAVRSGLARPATSPSTTKLPEGAHQ